MSSFGSISSLSSSRFEMSATRWANRHVDTDSSRASSSGETVATITVLQLPPSESRRTDVIIELRYGTNLCRSCSEMMTCSRKCNDRLMYLASRSTVPSMPVFLTRSDPARSTKCSFERRTTSEFGLRMSTASVKMQCDREEAMFDGVSEIIRFVSPTKRRFRASSSDRATCECEPGEV